MARAAAAEARGTATRAVGVVGALRGAISAAAVASLQRGESPEQTRAAMQHAAEIALHYVESLGRSAADHPAGRLGPLSSQSWQVIS